MKHPFLYFFIIIPSLFFAQQTDDSQSDVYFESMTDLLTMKLGFDNDIESFIFNADESDDTDNYIIRPNTSTRMTLGLTHRWLTLTIGYTPNFLAGSNSAKKGETSTFRLKTDIFINNWIQTIEYNKIKGYYIESDLPGFEDEVIILPTLRTKNFSITSRYKFNDKFSYKAFRNQNEIQRKSAGTFIPSATFNYFEIRDKAGFQDLTQYAVAIDAGYLHTFVINNKWFTSAGLSTGLGIEFNEIKYNTDNGKESVKNNDLALNVITELALGYNSNSFFSGFKLVGYAKTRDDKSVIDFSNSRAIYQFYIGYRLDPPKFLTKSLDWVEEKNPFNK